ncbi:MAG: hypothetical protein KVP17_004912, partial [Porospora cf. gigantea B]
MSRRELISRIERDIQAEWALNQVYLAQPPVENAEGPKEKYFVTFPYPYMNGRLHLGHAFSLTKAEFAARFQRGQGKRVLWPFAFHVTGMPISACADKLKNELNNVKKAEVKETDDIEINHTMKFSGNRTKLVAKTGPAKTQKEILMSQGISEEEVPLFINTDHWIHYFTPLGKKDLEAFGVAVDWRRSFITTDKNPYYDQFVRWQFLTLRALGKIKFGLRPAIFAPDVRQACLDHDRASGEGVGPQEYSLIKMKAQVLPVALEALEGKNVYFVCATLRPETMYGQTNCYVQPEGEYGVYPAFDKPMSIPQGYTVNAHVRPAEEAEMLPDVFICADRCARNMGFQGIIPVDEAFAPHQLRTVSGMDLIGTQVSAPLSQYDSVRVLPMLGVSMTKGSGVVTSVPSDSPDDWAALKDLLDKEAMRKQFNVDRQWCERDVVDIIEIPGMGTRAALDIYDKMKIQSQKDRQKLKDAKEEIYKRGFYEGTMIIGPYAGQKVQVVKDLVKADLLASGEAIAYIEPEKEVISRSGVECVVALCEQWYLDYANEQWTQDCLKWVKSSEVYAETGQPSGFHTYNPSTHNQMISTVSWLQEWACSRSYGLGTRIPWEEESLIESLSDSTLYFAYYTVAHLLQGNIEGSGAGLLGLQAEDLTPDFWNFIFGLSEEPPKGVPLEKAQRCRDEFNYWYPMDLRCSGKDLIFNHLTMALFNHVAIFGDSPTTRMPRSYWCNGHVQVDTQKMSKSLGNFLTMEWCLEEYTADATRIALADAGDSLEDANFQRDNATNALMRLYNLVTWGQKVVDGQFALRSDIDHDLDRMFINEAKSLANKARKSFEGLLFREGLKSAFFDMINARDAYKSMCDAAGVTMSQSAIKEWLSVFALTMSAITPHVCEHLWRRVLQKSTFVVQEVWPAWDDVDPVLKAQRDYLLHSLDSCRQALLRLNKKNKKAPSGPQSLVIYVKTEFFPWQVRVLDWLKEHVEFGANLKPLDLGYTAELKQFVAGFDKADAKQAMAFAAFQMKEEIPRRGLSALESLPSFDEIALLESYQSLFKGVGVES